MFLLKVLTKLWLVEDCTHTHIHSHTNSNTQDRAHGSLHPRGTVRACAKAAIHLSWTRREWCYCALWHLSIVLWFDFLWFRGHWLITMMLWAMCPQYSVTRILSSLAVGRQVTITGGYIFTQNSLIVSEILKISAWCSDSVPFKQVLKKQKKTFTHTQKRQELQS